MANNTNTQITVSNDYTKFTTVTGNRQVRQAHVKKIRSSIEQDPESIKYNPILVNEKYQVIDGQHRLEAMKQLDLPVYYIQVDGLKLHDVQKLNSVAKMWQPIDYAKAFSLLGNTNYTRYVDIKEGTYKQYSLNHDSLLKYLALDNPITSQSFNEGRLKVDDFSRSLELLIQLHEVGAFYPRFNIRSFALAFLRLARDERYDHKRMLEKVSKYVSMIEDYSKEMDYYKALIRVYNHNVSRKKKEYFGHDEDMIKG